MVLYSQDLFRFTQTLTSLVFILSHISDFPFAITFLTHEEYPLEFY